MIPVYKIEVYNSTPTLIYTITSEASNVYFREVITDGIGHFSFSVPTLKSVPDDFLYEDIALNDEVRIWMGYDSVSGTADFIGKITRISTPLNMGSGYVRVISGLSQGEILLRRLKKDTLWSAIGASTIVTELANDLGLGTGDIVADATAVTMDVQAKTYFDVLQAVSDYWASAGVQVKKDFYVDVDDDLVWKARPIRTTGVETLTVGQNIDSYRVTRDVDSVKNNIDVYGASYQLPGGSKDGYCEATTDWTSDGTVATNVDAKSGQYSIETTRNNREVYLNRSLSSFRAGWKNQRYIHLYHRCTITGGAGPMVARRIYLLAPNIANSFYRIPTWWDQQNIWYHFDRVLGDHGSWTETGSPDWEDIQGFRLYFDGGAIATDVRVRVDELYFDGGHYYNSASDGTSQSDYGQRDLIARDERLQSNAACEVRAETLLYQMKDPPVQIEVNLPLNMNVLVGDRLSMTIPAENITTTNFDVIAVQHSISSQGSTYARMVDSGNIRQPVETSLLYAFISAKQKLRMLYDDAIGTG